MSGRYGRLALRAERRASGSRNRISNGLRLAPVVGDVPDTTCFEADVLEWRRRPLDEGHVRATKAEHAVFDGVAIRSSVGREWGAMTGTQAELEARHTILGRRCDDVSAGQADEKALNEERVADSNGNQGPPGAPRPGPNLSGLFAHGGQQYGPDRSQTSLRYRFCDRVVSIQQQDARAGFVGPGLPKRRRDRGSPRQASRRPDSARQVGHIGVKREPFVRPLTDLGIGDVHER
jgi:hypothetical protein